MANFALVEQPHEPASHEGAEATAFGFGAGWYIALAMVVVIGLMLWGKAHHAIGASLDAKIKAIRDQLAEAESLRNDAEALKLEYEKKAKSVEKERKALLARAQKDADEIVAKASKDAEAMVERRSKMAEEKIEAEQRAAIAEIRATAAKAATAAAAKLIAEQGDAATDKAMVDQAISSL